jgi:hypothetical protein
MKRFLIAMILMSVLQPITAALTEEQKKIQDSFDNGFLLGQLYIAAQCYENTSQKLEYNSLAKEHNDFINETYGNESKSYLIPTLSLEHSYDTIGIEGPELW